MPKVKDVGLTSYLRKEERQAEKRRRAELRKQRIAEKRERKLAKLRQRQEYSEQLARTRKAQARARKQNKGSFFGVSVKKKKQSSTLNRKSRIRLI